MPAQLIVTKRLPRYEFVIRTKRSVQENSELLERYIRTEPRPRGFWFLDPRLDGQVSGSTFEISQHNVWLWGSVIPVIEGEIIPNEEGSDVVVQVRHRVIVLAVLGLVGLVSVIPMALGSRLDSEIVLEIALFCAVTISLGTHRSSSTVRGLQRC